MQRTETEELIWQTVEPLRSAIEQVAEACIDLTYLVEKDIKRLEKEIETLKEQ